MASIFGHALIGIGLGKLFTPKNHAQNSIALRFLHHHPRCGCDCFFIRDSLCPSAGAPGIYPFDCVCIVVGGCSQISVFQKHCLHLQTRHHIDTVVFPEHDFSWGAGCLYYGRSGRGLFYPAGQCALFPSLAAHTGIPNRSSKFFLRMGMARDQE